MVRAHRRRMTRRLVVILGTLGLLFAIVPVTPVLGASDRLPDLKVATTTDFRITKTSSGRRLLRFSGMMLNVGKGPFEVRGTRASTSKPWSVDQVIYRTGGATRRIHTTAQMNWAGDGHNHWHVLRMLTYHMWSTTSSTVRTAKIGFCFFDTNRRSTSLPGAPRSAKYLKTGCGTKNVLHTKVGISVGWADLYPSTYAYQWIDITGLPSGTYTVRGAVDLYNKFTELNENNNCTWSKISFTTGSSKVKLLGSGNSCSNDHKNSPFAKDIDWAVAGGIATDCDADMFCTTDLVSRADVASYISKAMHLPSSDQDFFTDDNGSSHEADINRVAAAGIMTGCSATTFCPAGTVSSCLGRTDEARDRAGQRRDPAPRPWATSGPLVQDQPVRAFANTCRHRGHELLPEGGTLAAAQHRLPVPRLDLRPRTGRCTARRGSATIEHFRRGDARARRAAGARSGRAGCSCTR